MASSQGREVLKEKTNNSAKAMITKKSKEEAAASANNDSKGSNKQKASSPAGSKEGSKRTKTTRPKPVYFWSNQEVMKWLRRQCTDYHTLYGSLFVENDITGRSLVRMNEVNLEKLGIVEKVHRDELWQEILKLRLKTDILEMRDLELKG